MSDKKTLYIHGGLQKTGSTALQKFFHNNRSTLKKYDVYYPESPHGWINHSDGLPTSGVYAASKMSYQDIFDEYILKIQQSECAIGLLSTEDIYYSNPKMFLYLKNLFNIKFIFYIRNYYNFIDSLQCTQIFFAGNLKVKYKYFTPMRKQKIAYPYNHIVKFCNIFSDECIIVKDYDKLKNIFIEDFLKTLNISAPISEFIPVYKENLSLKIPYLYFLAHTYMLPLPLTVRQTLRQQLSEMSNNDTITPRYRLIASDSFLPMTSTEMEDFKKVTKLAGNTDMHKKYLESYEKITLYPYFECIPRDQHHIFKGLSQEIQNIIQDIYLPAKGKDINLPILPPLPSEDMEEYIASYLYHYNESTQLVANKKKEIQILSNTIKNIESDFSALQQSYDKYCFLKEEAILEEYTNIRN